MINDRSLSGLPRRQKFTPVACVYECRATHTAGVRSGRHRIGRSASRGEPWKVIAHWDLQPTAAFHDRENRCNVRSRLWAGDVNPVLPTQSHTTHGILRQVIARLKFRIFQKSCKFPPKRERGLVSLAECAGRQCNGLRCVDLATNIVEKRLGCFLTPNMARGNTQGLAASFGVDGEQFVYPRHDRSCYGLVRDRLSCELSRKPACGTSAAATSPG